jgi:hypothetical protein
MAFTTVGAIKMGYFEQKTANIDYISRFPDYFLTANLVPN